MCEGERRLISSANLAQSSQCGRSHADVTGVWILGPDRVLLYFKMPPDWKVMRWLDWEGKVTGKVGGHRAGILSFWYWCLLLRPRISWLYPTPPKRGCLAYGRTAYTTGKAELVVDE